MDRVERDFISRPTFQPNVIRSKSSAAAGLSAWVINICKYFRIYQVGIECRPATGDATHAAGFWSHRAAWPLTRITHDVSSG